MKTKILLSEETRQRVEQAVKEAEGRTSGEIVTLVVNASDRYPGATLRTAVVVALAGAVALHLALPWLDPVWLIAAEVPLFITGVFIGRLAPVQRLFLSRVETAEEVRQRAQQAFLEHGVHRTREETGVLLFISLLEHRLEILADRGIREKVPQKEWDAMARRLAASMRNEPLEGLLAAISEVGTRLAEHFPRRADTADELPDGMRTE